MRLTRTYIDLPLGEGVNIALPPAAVTHLLRVLRLASGDRCVLFNGDGHDYDATLAVLGRERVDAHVVGRRAVDNESALAITLAQGVARGEKMDWILQKATELGVAGIAPVVTERTEVKLDSERGDKRSAHWRGVIASGCEQSGRARLPELEPIRPLAQFLTTPRDGALKLTLDPHGELTVADLPAIGAAGVVLLIGPEGGLSERDRHAAQLAGYRGLRLGPRILRTETAGVAAIAALQALRGDMR